MLEIVHPGFHVILQKWWILKISQRAIIQHNILLSCASVERKTGVIKWKQSFWRLWLSIELGSLYKYCIS